MRKKPKIEKNGNKTLNARIKIDYSKNSPQITFKYPDKKTQCVGSMLPNIYFIFIILFILYLFFAPYDPLGRNYDYDHLENFSKCVIKHEKEVLNNYSNVRYNLCKSESFFEIINKKFILLVLIYFLLPLLIFFPFKKKWDKIYPKWQSFFSEKKYRKFDYKDIKKSQGKYPYYIELPIFANIVCNYKATKDFSKYMKEFEIEEYNFHYLNKF